ncbi:ABC transporter permease [Propionicimonas sp.]|uniref:ABC transporter permease n=1 Tax=Propionicimonas sp. TaxID=1955623 RepID=UPI0017C7C50C|nr:ABC transporter permease [Propionicimonas sp.]MBU3977066.1 ABC transporter permease [Actinomycetota bacterium]MBU3985006.1 ABC transporter permease [Actinomycetota bacterium]MBU4007037.1 ABC transporter permease [Actinomycetota bacterium]MBU4064790.1 ABC transporter permease [Actinomycetota bacterium]
MTTFSAAEAVLDQVVRLEKVESADQKRARLSTGSLVVAAGLLLLGLSFGAGQIAHFAMSNAFDEVQLPTFAVPAGPAVLISAVLCLAAGVGLISGRLSPAWRRAAGVVAGTSFLFGFLSWAAATSALPFPVSNQLSGTVATATPLILGALAGVIGERAGVVNVAIEGQFLNAAFAAGIVGSITKSIPAALVAAVLTAVATAALLALFAIKYLMDQVVLGVVINLLASGLTGFLFDQLVQPQSRVLNSAPTMQPIPLGPLANIPFLGPILFNQTILVYLAVLSVAVVWVLLFKTRWGLRVRAVGEHPKAADTVGISVVAVRWQAVLVGGIFAGLGGAFFTVGSTGSFAKDLTVGNGFIALAALIMGRWHPIWAALMALFFGFVTQMASQLQTLSTPVPSEFLLLLPYIATIVAVAGLIGRSRAPAADGTPYIK